MLTIENQSTMSYKKWLTNSLLSILCLSLLNCRQPHDADPSNWTTPYEDGDGNSSPTYEEVIDFYIKLAKEFPSVNVQTLGTTDSGLPLHVVTFNPEGSFNFQKLGENKALLLINNGIHPGEPDGIDASMMLFRDLATGALEAPKNTVIACIPVYNIGGALQRNSSSRVNQNGPSEYGFRGNARNYDLNRDFIKADTDNAKTFASIFHLINPDVFIDTHVSNGADYQYVLTHLFTQHDKLGGEGGFYLRQKFIPTLEEQLQQQGLDITPYVNVYNRPPDTGFDQFFDHPRYSTGYTALWGTLGLMIETHMLKPYTQRVESTYSMLQTLIHQVDQDYDQIKEVRAKTKAFWMESSYYPVQWTVDRSSYSTRLFKGYQADTITSEITGLARLRYNQELPFTKEIPFYNRFTTRDSVAIPEGYILPASYKRIAELFRINQVKMFPVPEDTLILTTQYRIENFKTRNSAYEGHYLHYGTEVSSRKSKRQLRKGDLWIPTRQEARRYILESLEPEASDSFFNWNFFDPILQQKEGFSAYVFEDLAAEILESEPELREAFEKKKQEDADFSSSAYAQLQWIYRSSDFYEKAHNTYPVSRIETGNEMMDYFTALEKN